MTRDDVIQIAHEAGLHIATDVNWMPIIGLEYAEKFANLVSAAEREACAKVVEASKTEEENWNSYDWNQAVDFCAARIRVRSQ